MQIRDRQPKGFSRMTVATRISSQLSEKEWQQVVTETATWYGWTYYHSRPAIMKSGKWATALEGLAGFPDLVLVHETRGLVFAELKSEKGRLSHKQQRWIDLLRLAGQEVYVWKPSDFGEVKLRLKNRTLTQH